MQRVSINVRFLRSWSMAKRYYMPCYTYQSDATDQDRKEFERTYKIYKQIKKNCSDDWSSSYDKKASSTMVQQKEHYTKDICTLRSLICEHVMAGILINDDIKDDVIDEIQRHKKHRKYDLEKTLDHYQKKIDIIEELMQVHEDLLKQSDKIMEMQRIMDKVCISKLSDVTYEHDTFWSTDEKIRVDPDVSYVNKIASRLVFYKD